MSFLSNLKESFSITVSKRQRLIAITSLVYVLSNLGLTIYETAAYGEFDSRPETVVFEYVPGVLALAIIALYAIKLRNAAQLAFILIIVIETIEYAVLGSQYSIPLVFLEIEWIATFWMMNPDEIVFGILARVLLLAKYVFFVVLISDLIKLAKTRLAKR